MRRKKDDSNPKIQSAVAKSVNYEVSIADLAKRSERRAWMVAGGSLVMSLILAGGYFYMLPLKEKVPYLVMADAYTGTASMARLTGNFGDTGITASEALNRSNISHFVMARESYDAALISQGDWKTVYTMAAPQVASGYTQLHSRNNPDSPYNRLGTSRAIRVRILSIVFQGAKGRTPTGATVRFQRSLYDKTSGTSKFLDNKIATMSFIYDSNLKMSESDRIANPLGFRVTGYRVDSDFADTPPVTSDSALQQAAEEMRSLQGAAPTVPAGPEQPMQQPPTADAAAEVAPDQIQPYPSYPTDPSMQQQMPAVQPQQPAATQR